MGTPNSAAMGCSQPKLSRTGLRNILAFLKVELQHFLGGTRALLRLPVARGLIICTIIQHHAVSCCLLLQVFVLRLPANPRLIFFLSATTIATTSSYKSQATRDLLPLSSMFLHLCDTWTDREAIPPNTKRTWFGRSLLYMLLSSAPL